VGPIFTLGRDTLKDADEYQAEVLKGIQTRGYGRNKFSLSHPNRYKIGYLGEWAAHRHFTESGLQVTWSPSADLNSDRGDLQIGPYAIDVKMRSEWWHDVFMYLEEQWQARKTRCDFYIGGAVDADFSRVQLRCVISARVLESLASTSKYGNLGRCKPFEECGSIADAVEYFSSTV
jgi:hypothetical protein